MLEILAAYLLIKCYVAFDASKTSLFGYDPRWSGRNAERCIADFRTDVERFKATPAGKTVTAYQQKVRQAASLSREQLDRLLADVRQRAPRR